MKLVDPLDKQSVQLAVNAMILRRVGLSNDYELTEEKIDEQEHGFYEASVIFFVPGVSKDL